LKLMSPISSLRPRHKCFRRLAGGGFQLRAVVMLGIDGTLMGRAARDVKISRSVGGQVPVSFTVGHVVSNTSVSGDLQRLSQGRIIKHVDWRQGMTSASAWGAGKTFGEFVFLR
jgi:hypothetical protein